MQLLLAMETVCCFLGLAHQDITVMVLYQWLACRDATQTVCQVHCRAETILTDFPQRFCLVTNSVTCNLAKPHVNLQNQLLKPNRSDYIYICCSVITLGN